MKLYMFKLKLKKYFERIENHMIEYLNFYTILFYSLAIGYATWYFFGSYFLGFVAYIMYEKIKDDLFDYKRIK